MSMRTRPLSIAAVALLASSLAGCGTVNEKLSAGMGDYVPQWAGGLPADAPPRPGTPQYDAYMKDRERKRLLPAADREKEEQAQKGTTGTTSGNTVR
jgi:predicted small secreted protein